MNEIRNVADASSANDVRYCSCDRMFARASNRSTRVASTTLDHQLAGAAGEGQPAEAEEAAAHAGCTASTRTRSSPVCFPRYTSIGTWTIDGNGSACATSLSQDGKNADGHDHPGEEERDRDARVASRRGGRASQKAAEL